MFLFLKMIDRKNIEIFSEKFSRILNVSIGWNNPLMDERFERIEWLKTCEICSEEELINIEEMIEME